MDLSIKRTIITITTLLMSVASLVAQQAEPVRADGTASSGRVGRRHFSERFFKILRNLFFYFLRANFVGSYKLSIFASVMPNYLIVPVCWRKILLLE